MSRLPNGLPRRIATLSVHTSPLDQPGTGDAGGLNVYVVQVAKRLAARGIPAHRVTLPDSQAVKTFRTAEYLADVFADHAMHKDDLVIAVGGEGICDIAGFVAATFNRGMRLCLVPTTLVVRGSCGAARNS